MIKFPTLITVPFFCIVLLSMTPVTLAQIYPGQITSPFNSIQQNTISNIGSFGDTLWIGPRLNYIIDNESDWRHPERADSVTNGRGRLFSIDLAQDTIVAGIGYSDTTQEESVQSQMGFYISTDGGRHWELIDTSKTLDSPDANTIRYGGNDLETVPIIVPQQSPPFMVDFQGDVIFFAGWASGIRRSTDFGQTWERIVLPPFSISDLNPENDYDFVIDPRGDGQSNDFLNYLGFSVLIGQDSTVYAGTAGGLNISDNALHAPADSIRWRHIRQEGRHDGLLGSWIISIRENPYDNAVWMTNWITMTGEDREGIVVTRDGGETFDQYLSEERLYDIGFRDETIYAVGVNGVFISPDNGDTWEQHRRIQSANTFIKPNATFFTVANTGERVWIGSDDGLASTVDNGDSWEITRVNFPLDGKNRYQSDAPDVDTYAYPNPFSPRQHDLVRIKFENKDRGDVTIRLYDFGMNLIRVLDQKQELAPGTYEAVWDGTDQQGRKVANGTVFYEVANGNRQIMGKILLLE